MVNVSELRPGMQVRIVDKWDNMSAPNAGGHMDCYLGRVVTVAEIVNDKRYFHIEEDNRRTIAGMCLFEDKWFFDGYMVKEIIEDNDEPLQAKPIAKLFS